MTSVPRAAVVRRGLVPHIPPLIPERAPMSDDTRTALLITGSICAVIFSIAAAITAAMAVTTKYSPDETEMKFALARDMLRGCAEKP